MNGHGDRRKAFVMIITIMLVLGSAVSVSASAVPILESERVPAESEEPLEVWVEQQLESVVLSTVDTAENDQSMLEETIIDPDRIPLGSDETTESENHLQRWIYQDLR